jgi:hypothetical protein
MRREWWGKPDHYGYDSLAAGISELQEKGSEQRIEGKTCRKSAHLLIS